MAETRVDDRQLKLDDVDQHVVLKASPFNLTLQSPTPMLRFISNGTEDYRLRAATSSLTIDRSLTGGSSFTTFVSPLIVEIDEGFNGVSVRERLSILGTNSHMRLPTAGSVASISNFSLFRDTVSTRLAWRQSSSVANIVAVHEDFVTREVPTGAVDGVNDTFTLADTPVVGSESVYLNGLLQNLGAGNDYTISGDTITFSVAPETGDVVLVSYLKTALT